MYVSFEITCLLTSLLCSTARLESSQSQPLLLTPLINSGNIEQARKQSLVHLNNITSHSGYLTVNQETDSNLFFWFFKAKVNWQQSPLLLWLQGGPGSSSMFGLFTENVPYLVTKQGIKPRKYSWTDKYNVIYIDNPIGTGYSYTKNYYVTTEDEIGLHLYTAMVQFFRMFPELRANEFFITGESYAGKYLPTLAYTISRRNLHDKVKINLKGLVIGNGYCDPEHMHGYASYLHRLGLIDHKTRLFLESKNQAEKILIRGKQWSRAWSQRAEIFKLLSNLPKLPSVYDYTRENRQDHTQLEKFLNDYNIKRKLHVAKNFTFFSQPVYDNLKNEMPTSVKSSIEQLLQNHRILFFSGQLDIIVAHQLTTDFLKTLQWDGAELYESTEKQKWYWNGRLAGYYKNAGNLIQVLVRDAGHMVPTSKPRIIMDLLDKFIRNEF